MKQDVITRRARALLAEELSTWSLGDINHWFADAGVALCPDFETNVSNGGSLVSAYLRSLDLALPLDVAKFIKVANPVVRQIEQMWEYRLSHILISDPKEDVHPLVDLLSEMDRCGFPWSRGEFVDASLSARLADVKTYAEDFELSHLAEHIHRIERSLETDPGQAIGSAKELVETVAKTILKARGVSHGTGDDLLVLGRLVFTTLKQLPFDVPDASKGAATLKRTLNNLMTVVQGISEMRGLYGTGHGKDGTSKGLQARHAKLVVGAAATLATYWVETDRDMSVGLRSP